MNARIGGIALWLGLCLSGAVRAGTGIWTSESPAIPSRFVTALAVDPSDPSRVYGATTDRLYRSTDSGLSWLPTSVGANEIVIDTRSSLTVYSGLSRSTNAGASWSNLGASLTGPVSAFALDPNDAARMYAGTAYGGPHGSERGYVYRSTDAGTSWSRVAEGYTHSIAVDASSTVCVAMSQGLLRSTDAGASFSRIDTPDVYARRLLADPRSPSTIYGTSAAFPGFGPLYRSIDGGRSWVTVGGLPPIGTLALDPTTSPSTLIAATFEAPSDLYRSTDAGETWTRAGSVDSSARVSALAAGPGSLLHAGTHGDGALRSLDSGATWTRSGQYWHRPDVASLAVDPKVPSVVFAGTNSHSGLGTPGDVFRSTDSGRTWTPLKVGLTRDGAVSVVAIDPVETSNVYAGTWLKDQGVFRSTDAGDTWSPTTLTGSITLLAVDPKAPATLYAAGRSLHRSTDAGMSWTPWGDLGDDHFLTALLIDPSTPTTLYVGDGGRRRVFKSLDAGRSFSPASSGLPDAFLADLAIDPSNPSRLYAATYAGVYRSTDSGGTWVAASEGLTSRLTSALAIDPRDTSTLYVGTSLTWDDTPETGVFRSTDFGESWVAVDTGLPDGLSVRDLVLDPTGDTTLHAALGGYSVAPDLSAVWGAYHITDPSPGSLLTVPIVLSTPGLNGSFFTSELALTNLEAVPIAISYRYTSVSGGWSAMATETIPAGRQRVFPDAVEHLGELGIPVGGSGVRMGTLRVEASGKAAVTVRTSTPVAFGRAGVAYHGLSPARLSSDRATVCGLRRNALDRSNIAVLNAGTVSSGPIDLRLTSGATAISVRLAPGGFAQIPFPDASGCVSVERVAGGAPFYAYGVVNDQVTSDGSFLPPIAAGPSPVSRATLPVLVETPAYSSELVVANRGDRSRTLHGTWVSAALTGGALRFDLTLAPREQQILPAFVQLLRSRGVMHDPPGGNYAGAVFFTSDGGDLRDLFIGARALTPDGTGGRYGVFIPAVLAGTEAATTARLHALRQDAENRTNLVLVNVGSVDGSPSTFRIEIYDGDAGALTATATGITVPARGFLQIDSLLSRYAPGVSNGRAVVTRTTGNNPFIAYAVVNDGARPGERSGDGAYIAADTAPVP